jgi:hypothetical protein
MEPAPDKEGRPLKLGCFGCLGIVVVAITIGAVLEYRHPTLAPQAVRVTSAAYQAGLKAGETFGQEERRTNGARMSPEVARKYAETLPVPDSLTPAEYQDGWVQGYQAGYGAAAK